MSQNGILLEALLRGESITPARAFELCGSYACHSRIAELRARGYRIDCRMEWGYRIDCRMESDGRRRWGSYSLRRPEQIPLYPELGSGLVSVPQKDEAPLEAGPSPGR